MTKPRMDAGVDGGYLRRVGVPRPTRTVALITVAAGLTLGGAGFAVGHRAADEDVAGEVVVKPVTTSDPADPIIIPSSPDLPER